jgi:hypothetical protein
VHLSDGPVDIAIGIQEDILCNDVLSPDELPSALNQPQNIQGDPLQR